MTDWHVIVARPNQERRAGHELARAGCFDVYLPTRITDTIHKRSKKRLQWQRPLFPRYLFAQVPPWLWYHLKHIRGVAGYLQSDNTPLRVPASTIEQFRQDEYDGEFNSSLIGRPNRHKREEAMRRLFQIDSTARVIDGPFASFYARIAEVHANEQIKAEVEIFGRATMVTFEKDQLEPMEGKK